MGVKDSGGPAYPFEYHNQTGSHQPGFFDTGMLAPGASQQFAGMTLRDYFAAKAMQAFAADAKRGPDTLYMNYEIASKEAYAIADAMLAERSVPSEQDGALLDAVKALLDAEGGISIVHQKSHDAFERVRRLAERAK